MEYYKYEFYFRHIVIYLSFLQEHELSDMDITKQQAQLLQYISHSLENGHTVTRKELQKIMGGLKGPSITSLLNALSRKGFLIRRPATHDGRYMELTVTDAGHYVVQRMDEIIQLFEKSLIDNMQEDEQKEFLYLLKKAYQNVVKNYNKF